VKFFKTLGALAIAFMAAQSAYPQSAPFSAYSIATLGGNCSSSGAIPYQNSVGVTLCTPSGLNGQVMTLNGSNVPSWTTVSGTGTVTSVGLAMPSIFSVAGSPITASGTLTTTLASQTANTFFAAPSGSAGAPTFRAILGLDMPPINLASTANGGVTGTLPVANGGTGVTTSTGSGANVLGTSPTIATPTISSPTVSGTLSGATGTFSGTLTANALTLPSQTAKRVFAAPTGSAGAPTFRQLITDDANYTAVAGATARTVTSRLNDVISVKDFGALCDGSTDDLAAFNAAITYTFTTPNFGGQILVPDGTCVVSGPINWTGSGISLVGNGPNSSRIKTTSTTLGIIRIGFGSTITSQHTRISGIGFLASSPMTAAAAIYANNAYDFRMENIATLSNIFNGVQIENSDAGTFDVHITNFHLGGILGDGILLGLNSTTTNPVTDIFVTDGQILPGSPTATAGIHGYGVGGLYVSGVDITNQSTNFFNNAVAFHPSGTQQSNAILLNEVLADNSTDTNIYFGGSGKLSDIQIVNSWASTSKNTDGISFDNANLNNAKVVGSIIDSNDHHGVSIHSGTNIQITSSSIMMNSVETTATYDGVHVDANISSWVVTNNMIGQGGYFANTGGTWKQKCGVFVATGTSTNYIIATNWGANNNTAIVCDNGTGTNKAVVNNIGG
jgi:hypothetical protein